MAETLPEGTDHVIPGATRSETGDRIKDEATDMRGKASAKAAEIKDQISDKARTYAEEGKARASDGLDSVAKLIGDSVAQIEEKLGATYGGYARRAAEAVSDFSGNLRGKQVDELMDDARSLVRRSPAVAIGAAAATGFVLARLIKAGSHMLDEAAKSAEEKAPADEKQDIAADISDSVRKAPGKSKSKDNS